MICFHLLDSGKLFVRYIDSDEETDSENESCMYILETERETVETNDGFYTDMDTESENETAGSYRFYLIRFFIWKLLLFCGRIRNYNLANNAKKCKRIFRAKMLHDN